MSERYDQLKIHYVSYKGQTKANIVINGCNLIGLLSFIEARIKAEDDEAPVGSYRFLPPEVLYEGLVRTETEDRFEKRNDAPLTECANCGEIHCWSVFTIVERGENSVIWTLRHNHRDWDYGLKLRFDRIAYDAEMNGLRHHSLRAVEGI